MRETDSCFAGEPGTCASTGELLSPAEETAVDLQMAHHLRRPGEWSGRPPTVGESEELHRGVDALFAQMSTDRQVRYPSIADVEAAATELMRMVPESRDGLWDLISQERREAIVSYWGDESRVTLSA